MINKIQNTFTIQDLELLTGVKAHTIRIWEKRYNLLQPTRLNRNIRLYQLSDLQKILNVSLLYRHNHKISGIANYSDRELSNKAKAIALDDVTNSYHINSLIVSMFTFSESLFEEVYQQQSEKQNFENIFVNTYLPLLNHIGVLWQTDSLQPAHEHFISNLIYQKISLNIAAIESKNIKVNNVHVLFLPDGEIHELGLLFLNYHLKLNGNKVIYLGRDVPIENLADINSRFNEITWVTNFIIDKSIEDKTAFINGIQELLAHTNNKCFIIGNVWKSFPQENLSNSICFYDGFEEVISLNK
jgi:methanogenic corrinoid protein MtbC1